MDTKLFYKVKEYAKLINMSPAWVRERINRGEIEHTKRGRCVFIPASEVRKLSGEQQPAIDVAEAVRQVALQLIDSQISSLQQQRAALLSPSFTRAADTAIAAQSFKEVGR